MAKAIILYNYNKYYNRIIRRLDNFAEYQALITSPDNGITPPQYRGLLREGFNFDHNDGVHASKVLEIKENEDVFFRTDHPDYIVIEEEYNSGTLEEPVITKNISRWFILDLVKLRGCKFRFSLRRDLLADFYNQIMTTPAFIERGNPAIDDPAIFNKEGFTFNQIKKHELLLNNTKLSGKGEGWIVGYLAREANPSAINATGHQSLPPSDLIPDYTTLPQGLRTLISNGTGTRSLYKWKTRMTAYRRVSTSYESHGIEISEEGQSDLSTGTSIRQDATLLNSLSPYSTFFKKENNAQYSVSNMLTILREGYRSIGFTNNNIKNKINDWYSSLNLTNRFTDDYAGIYNNMIVKKDGKVYKIVIIADGEETEQSITYKYSQISAQSSALCISFKKMFDDYIFDYPLIYRTENMGSNWNVVKFARSEQKYQFSMQLVDFQEINATVPATRNENLEAPYDLFCIPIGELAVKSNNVVQFTTMINTAFAIARGIAVAGTTTKVYDIQVLPYCPYPEILNSDGDIDIYGYDENYDYSYITNTVGGITTNIGIILYPRSCRGTFDLTIPESFEGYNDFCVEDTVSALSKKVKSETQIARFVSPNFSAMFEINVQKNEGISELNVDYFYKPYSPYIHVAPYFKGLYGNDYNDPKGLICSGDFSISTAQSQWAQYEIQNKNFELIFNRQIENLDINNQITYEQQEIASGINAWSTGISGAVSGAMIGALVGGPVGLAVGAVGVAALGGASGGLSAYGRSKDLEYLAKSQQEARSYMKDMYTYNLGNIQALPNTLTKVSSLTENNKIFPFIEFYDCTDEEKEALRNKIIYNGMTVMRIGTIDRFLEGDLQKYVQAQLIRLVGINEDSHVVSELANELKMGAYYYGTNPIST